MGNIIVADRNNHRIVKRSSADALTYVSQIGSNGSGNDQFNYPADVAIYGATMYVADTSNHRVVKRLVSDLSYIDKKTILSCSGICYCDGYLYVTSADFTTPKVYKLLASDLSTVTSIGTKGTGNDQFNAPKGICCDGTHVYVCDFNNSRVVKRLASDLSYVAQVGTLGTGDDQFDHPYGICTDGTNIYIMDNYNARLVKRLCSDLTYVSKIGSSGSTNDKFAYPNGLRTDRTYLYIADGNNHRIVKRLNSDLSYVSKIGGTGTGNDQFNTPSGVGYVSAPTSSAINPTTGVNNNDSLSIAITGTDFNPGAIAKLVKAGQSDITATSTTVNSSTSITAVFNISGAATGAWDVVVTNFDGALTTLAGSLTVSYPAPTVTAIDPNTALTTETAKALTITGTGFRANATVKLQKNGQSDITCSSVSVVGPTEITCVANCAVVVGGRTAQVTNDDAQYGSGGSLTVSYPAPTVTAIGPATGNIGQASTEIIISGENYREGATARLTKSGQDDIVATGLTVDTDIQITATFAILGVAYGQWNMVVENDDAQTGTKTNALNLYSWPVPSASTPASGNNDGSVNITNLAGTGFVEGCTVYIWTLDEEFTPVIINATNVVFVSSTKLTCTLPLTGAAVGTWALTVENPDTAVGANVDFEVEYPPPTVESISPVTSKRGILTSAEIAGHNFRTGAVVQFTKNNQASISGLNVVVTDSENITVDVPFIAVSALGTWNVEVINADDSKTGTLTNGITCLSNPDAISSSPSDDYVDNDVIITVTGTGFIAGSSLWLWGNGGAEQTQATDVIVTSTQITGTINLDGLEAELKNLIVLSPDGEGDILVNVFTAKALPVSAGSNLDGGGFDLGWEGLE